MSTMENSEIGDILENQLSAFWLPAYKFLEMFHDNGKRIEEDEEQVDSWEDSMENQMSVEEFLNMLMTRVGKEWRKMRNK